MAVRLDVRATRLALGEFPVLTASDTDTLTITEDVQSQQQQPFSGVGTESLAFTESAVATTSGGMPTGWNASDYDPAGTILFETYTGYATTAAVQANVTASFGSGGSAVLALGKYNGDAVFPNGVLVVTQVYNDDQSGASGASPELRRSFTANANIWVRTAFRYLGPSTPGFTATSNYTTQGVYPTGHANAYKCLFITWSGSSNRMEVVHPNTTNYLMGLGMTSVTSRTEQNLVTLYGQPSGTSPWCGTPTGGQSAFPTGLWTGLDWWEITLHWKKLSATSCVARFWLRNLSQGTETFNPGAYYFNGLLWTNCVGTVATASGISVGVNRNKTAPDDGAFTDIYPAGGPQKGMHLLRGPSFVLDGAIIADPFGIGSHGGGPY